MHDCLKLLAFHRRSTMSDLLREAVGQVYGEDLVKLSDEQEAWLRERGLKPGWKD